MDALRSVFLAMTLLVVGCGATAPQIVLMNEVDRAEAEFAEARAAEARDKAEAEAAQKKAEASKAARATKALAYGKTLSDAALANRAIAADLEKKACGADPGRCVQSGLVAPPLEPSVDVKVGFSSFDRLPGSSYPTGWILEVQGGDQKGGGSLVLLVNNVPKTSVLRPVTAEAAAACYRFTEKAVVSIKCPTQ